jgi:hypothetical protein
MTIQTAQQKNNLATAYAAAAVYGALYTTVPGASAGTEPTGGSPAYARKPIVWGTAGAVGPLGAGSQPATPGVIYGQATFDVPAGAAIAGSGLHTAATGGTYLDGGPLTSQPFATQGQYTENFVYTQG